MARADDFGKVSLYKDPIVIKDQEYTEFGGHSSHVTSCRFSQFDSHLYTTGGEDQCVMQWKVRANMPSQQQGGHEDDEVDDDDEDDYGDEAEVEGGEDEDDEEEGDDDDDVDEEAEGVT